MDKKKLNKKVIISASGTVLAAVSVGVLVAYTVRKALRKKPSPAELVLGLVGVAAGVGLTTYEHFSTTKVLKVEEVLDDNDAGLVDQNISEVLGVSAADAPRKKKITVKTIELDDETTIEDFIF